MWYFWWDFFFSVAVLFFLFLCLVLDIFFGTVTQNFPGVLGQSISLFIWAFVNFVYDDQEQFSPVFSKRHFISVLVEVSQKQ